MQVVRLHSTLFVLFALVCIVLFFAPCAAEAQFGGLNTQASLVANPPYPEPNRDVSIALSAYAMDTSGATITWYVDGVEQTTFKNERSMTTTVGELGTEQTIRAVVSPLAGPSASLSLTLKPSYLDIIVEADTEIPRFYKGRALPSSGAPVRIVAIPNVSKTASLSSYTYIWELDNKVLFGGPVRGKYAADITMPTYNNALLSVSVIASSGELLTKKTTRLTTAKPELYFYVDNPLRGISRRTIDEKFALVEDEVTVRAVPYFISKGLTKTSGTYEWQINGRPVENVNDDPLLITLRKTGGSGSADIRFRINNTKELLQYVVSSFTVFFE